jgi:hypothetical protein
VRERQERKEKEKGKEKWWVVLEGEKEKRGRKKNRRKEMRGVRERSVFG